MPDWFGKMLTILDALSGWVLFALAASLALVLLAPTPTGVDLGPLRRDWGGWIYAAFVVFGSLACARLAQWVTALVREKVQQERQQKYRKEQEQQEQAREQAKTKKEQKELERRKCEILKYLDTLSEEERTALHYLVQRNQRTGIGPIHFGPLHTLSSKGLLEMTARVFSQLDAPFTVPDFVWDALLERKEELFGGIRPKLKR
jgi:Sec-independent protein translocase protein TatA